MKRITVDLDDKTHHALKVFCAREDITIQALVSTMLALELRNTDEES